MKRISVILFLTTAFIIPDNLIGQEDRWEEVSLGLGPSFAGVGAHGKSVFEVADKLQLGGFASIGYFYQLDYALGADLYFFDHLCITLGVGPLAYSEITELDFIGTIPYETTRMATYYSLYQTLNYDIRLSNSLTINTGLGYGFAFE